MFTASNANATNYAFNYPQGLYRENKVERYVAECFTKHSLVDKPIRRQSRIITNQIRMKNPKLFVFYFKSSFCINLT